MKTNNKTLKILRIKGVVFLMHIINDFSYLFTKDSIYITRWDSIDIKIAGQIFMSYKETITNMIQFAEKLINEKHQKLELFLCDGRKLVNMIS
jgi:hypothetical protein